MAIFWRVLGVITTMFAGHFFLGMVDDLLKQKKWLKYKSQDQSKP